jgi:hypothetical protein
MKRMIIVSAVIAAALLSTQSDAAFIPFGVPTNAYGNIPNANAAASAVSNASSSGLSALHPLPPGTSVTTPAAPGIPAAPAAATNPVAPVSGSAPDKALEAAVEAITPKPAAPAPAATPEKKEVIQAPTNLNIGQIYAGGIVVSVDYATDGLHGFIADVTDLPGGAFENPYKKVCADSTSGGHGGWTLPTIDQLQEMYYARHLISDVALANAGNGFIDATYISSTMYNDHAAWAFSFVTGEATVNVINEQDGVRCVMSF